MSSDKPNESMREVPSIIEEPSSQRLHPKAIIAVMAMNVIVFAQITSIVGSGLLAVQTTGFLGDSSKSPWLSTCLTIFTLALNPPLSQVADYWGRKWIMVVASTGGFVGPIVIARASSVSMLIAGFCLLGIATGCQAFFYLIPSEILPRRYRPAAQASLNISTSVGAMTSILMGGALLQDGNYQNYRTYWYTVAGCYFVAILGITMGYNPPPREQQLTFTFRQKLAHLDWVGFLLLPTGLTLLCVALQWSKNPYSWKDAHILAPFIISVTLTTLFIVYQTRYKTDGIFHHSLFESRNFGVALLAIFVEGLAYFTCNSYFTFEVQTLLQVSLFSAGLRFVVLFAATVVSSVLVGVYTMWTKRLRDSLIAGFALLALFNSLMAATKSSTSSSVLWGYPVIGGMGLGFLLVNLTVITQLSTPRNMISLTTGIFMATRSLGGAVGLAINTAIFNDAISSNLGPKISAAVLPLGFSPDQLGSLIEALSSGNPEAVAQVPGVTPQIAAAGALAWKEAYLISFRNVWIAAAAFSGAGIIVSFFLREVKSEFTADVDAPMADTSPRNRNKV